MVQFYVGKNKQINPLHTCTCMRNAAAAAKSLRLCPTLCDPRDGSPTGSPVPGILQARTLEWVAISFSNAWKWKVKVKFLSHVRLFATPWTAAHLAPLPMGFSRQEYWSGVPLPSPCMRNEEGWKVYYSCLPPVERWQILYTAVPYSEWQAFPESQIGIVTTCRSVGNASSQASAQNYRIRMCTVIILHGFMHTFKVEENHFSIHHAVRNATTQLFFFNLHFFTCNPQHSHFNASHCLSTIIP